MTVLSGFGFGLAVGGFVLDDGWTVGLGVVLLGAWAAIATHRTQRREDPLASLELWCPYCTTMRPVERSIAHPSVVRCASCRRSIGVFPRKSA